MNTTSNKKLFENSFFYTLSGILTKCINFILLPLFTASLTTEDYGIYSLLGSFNSVALYFTSLGLETAIIRFYCDYKDDKNKLKRLIGTCMMSVIVMDVIFNLLCVVFNKPLCGSILDGIAFTPYVVLSLIELTFISLNTIYRTVLKAEGAGKKLSISSFVMFLLSTSATLVLVVAMKKGAVGMLLAFIIARFAFLLFAIYDLLKRDIITICVDFSLLKKALKYSLPIIPHSMSTYIATFVSKMFLNKSVSLSAVGVYNIASQIAAMIDTVQDSVGQAYRPWLNELLSGKEDDKSGRIQQISELLMDFFCIMFIGISYFSYEAVLIFLNNSYQYAWRVVPILAIAFSFKAMYYFYIYKCFYFTETANKIFIISILTNLINIFTSYLLIPHYGMYGTAVSQLIADIVRALLAIGLANTKEKIGYRLGKLFKILCISWVFIFVGVLPMYINNSNELNLLLFLYKLMLLLLYLCVFYMKNKKLVNKFIISLIKKQKGI